MAQRLGGLHSARLLLASVDFAGIEHLQRTDDRALVHRVIYDELCRDVVREESRAAYRDVIARLVDGGAQGVVLGCTEIGLLVGAADSEVPLFPTTRLHVEAGVDAALPP